MSASGQRAKRRRTGRRPRELTWPRRAALRLLVAGMRLWTRTLRFEMDEATRRYVEADPPAGIGILWHNRLFAAPECFRRLFRRRKLAALISASRDGAWLAGLLRPLGIRPVRGSGHRRGAQAFRELIAANRAGCDVVVTPDGSKGPVYDMKPGAVLLAWTTGAPVTLLSLNFDRAWRLRSWDRFYLPRPFSRVAVRIKRFGDIRELGADGPREAARRLKVEMDAITEDAELLGEPDSRDSSGSFTPPAQSL